MCMYVYKHMCFVCVSVSNPYSCETRFSLRITCIQLFLLLAFAYRFIVKILFCKVTQVSSFSSPSPSPLVMLLICNTVSLFITFIFHFVLSHTHKFVSVIFFKFLLVKHYHSSKCQGFTKEYTKNVSLPHHVYYPDPVPLSTTSPKTPVGDYSFHFLVNLS